MRTLISFITEETKLTPHKELRAEGWKKTGQSGEHHVYTHSGYTGHEIHLHPKTGAFEHKVKFNASHVQKGKGSPLAKHLNAHSRHTDYDVHTRERGKESSAGWDRGRAGYSDGPGPRGYQG